MTEKELIQIAINKKDKSWNQLVLENNLNFKNGDCFRKWFGRHKDIKQTSNNLIYEIQKERYKIRDERNLLNKVIRDEARFDNIVELFTDAIKNSKLTEFKYVSNNIVSNNKFTVACLNDLHCGAKFDNYWGKYNIEIFKQRFFQYINEIIKISKFHDSRDLIVLGLADYVNGLIHTTLRITNECDVVTQTQIVAEVIAEGLNVLHQSKCFNTIDFYSVLGNHDRVSENKEENLYVENFARFIPWYLKARCFKLENVIIHDNDIDDGIVLVQKNKVNIIGVHGDLDKVKQVTQNMTLMLKIIPDLICLGHLHHFSADTIDGVRIVMSGTMSGTDDHSKDIRKVGYASQALMIYNGNKRECIYDVELD